MIGEELCKVKYRVFRLGKEKKNILNIYNMSRLIGQKLCIVCSYYFKSSQRVNLLFFYWLNTACWKWIKIYIHICTYFCCFLNWGRNFILLTEQSVCRYIYSTWREKVECIHIPVCTYIYSYVHIYTYVHI